MEKMSRQPQRSPSTVPLARDQDGNIIELPDGTACWRVRRQTGGRPRVMFDASKRPLQLPLDYTIADVEDVVAPGSYLLDAVDANGEPVGVTIGLTIGMLRNADAEEPANDDGATVVPTSLPSTTSEVRLVLEANVRATQMAFLHNQRTLELGLRMAETLRDSVQVLASSQADWIKSISSARGFFRNGGQALPPVEVKQLTVTTGGGDDEGDDDDDAAHGHGDGGDDGSGGGDGNPTKSGHWAEQFMPIISQVVMQVMPVINAWSAKQMDDANSRRRGGTGVATPPSTSSDAAASMQAVANVEEQRAAQAKRDHAEKIANAVQAASANGGGISVITLLQHLPPTTSAKLMKIQAALSMDEQADATQIFKTYSASGMEDLLVVFDLASLEQCVDFLRRLIGEWRAMQAARRARASGSSAGGTSGAGSGVPDGTAGQGAPGGLSGPNGDGSAVSVALGQVGDGSPPRR